MKLALTGATGFIGSHVLTELQERGHSVVKVAYRNVAHYRSARMLVHTI